MGAAFTDLYHDTFATLGLPLDASHAGPADPDMPRALADWHRLTGAHPINAQGNRLLPPGDIFIRDGKRIFFEEEQGAILWAFDYGPATGDDPEVWQGVMVDGSDDIFWYSEEMSLSAFLVAMLRWKVTGEEPQR